MHALDLSLLQWQQWCLEHHLPPYLGKQIFGWIYHKQELNNQLYSNISLSVREKLSQSFDWDLPRIDSQLISQDTSIKFLLQTFDGLLIEMVLMPSPNRVTLCLSCQVGCRMGCHFCQTGKMGFKRNLSVAEILGQLFLANSFFDRPVTNVVFMGMGEPLDNYEAVVEACRRMIDPQGLALSKSRVTLSTSGLVPEIKKLAAELPIRLAISLHSADEEKRTSMMPINKKYSLRELKEALLAYPSPHRYGITFEYVMIEGVNDSLDDAKKLVRYLHGLKAKVNLIPINHFPGVEMLPSSKERLEQFQAYLTHRSIAAPIRYSRGQDISGGCGQLAAKRADELHLDPRHVRKNRCKLTVL